MPALLTHVVMADHVAELLDDIPRAKEVVLPHKKAYYSGSQGGDYFYSYKFYSMWAGASYKMFGYALHRARVPRFFAEGADYIKNNYSDNLLSFFYGYITHYYLDMYLHPLIMKLGPESMSTHNIVEFAIDSMYAYKNGIDPMTFNKGDFIRDTLVETDEIDRFFDAMMKKLYYGFTLKPNSYQTTYKYFEKFHRMLQRTDRWGVAKNTVRDTFTLLKTRTLRNHPYEEIKDWYDYEEFYVLINKAIEKSLNLISIVDRYIHDECDLTIVECAVFNVNANGVPVVPREERKMFRKMYKKLRVKW